MNLAAVAGLKHRSMMAVWYRAIHPQYLATALGYAHTRLNASRYSAGPNATIPYDILYFAENPSVALFEVGALFGSPLVPTGVVANPAKSWTITNAQIQLTKVADLTDAADSQAALSTSAQELTGDWQGYQQRGAGTSVSGPIGVAPTQELGAALYASGLFEGFLTVSAKMPYQMVLGIFLGRLAPGNFIRYSYSDAAGQMQNLQIP